MLAARGLRLSSLKLEIIRIYRLQLQPIIITILGKTMENRVRATLSPAVLSRRKSLAEKCDPVVLTGKQVILKPLEPLRDTKALYSVSNGEAIDLSGKQIMAYDADELIWRFLSVGPFASSAEMLIYTERLASVQNGLSMAVFHRDSGRQVGVTCFMNNMPEHLRIEIGNIWYSPVVQRSAVNTESTLLMLDHAFSLGYRRVEWKCNALNERSRHAALRLGFSFEGVHRNHLIFKDASRDTAWYSIIDSEWPEKREKLLAMLAK